MINDKNISQLVREFLAGSLGEGAVLFHKKMHKKGSGEFACVRGIADECPDAINCPNCFHDNSGSYCLKDGQSVIGLLAIEEKHRALVERGAPGAYSSIKEAMTNLTYR